MQLRRTMTVIMTHDYWICRVADPGEGPRGPGPPYFRPKWGPKGGNYFFEPPPPLISGFGWPILLLIWRSGSATDAVPSLALNYHCKKYEIIYESVYSYLCTCMRNKYSCKIEFVWNVHIQVMLKVISISVLNMHELVETWLPEG